MEAPGPSVANANKLNRLVEIQLRAERLRWTDVPPWTPMRIGNKAIRSGTRLLVNSVPARMGRPTAIGSMFFDTTSKLGWNPASSSEEGSRLRFRSRPIWTRARRLGVLSLRSRLTTGFATGEHCTIEKTDGNKKGIRAHRNHFPFHAPPPLLPHDPRDPR